MLDIIPLDPALALKTGSEEACHVGVFEVVGETYDDVGAWAYEMEAASVAYLEVALALGAFAEDVLGVAA